MKPIVKRESLIREPDLPLRILVLVALLGGCSSKPAEGPAQSAAAPPPAAAPAETSEAAPAPEILSVLSVEHEVDIVTRREGVVVEILHDVGAAVEAGEMLARLDDRELLSELEKARAEVQHTRARVSYGEADVRVKDAAHKRALEMKQHNLISDADLEKAQFEIEAARFNLESLRLAVTYAEANVRQQELELEKTRIRAPFAGVVVRRYLRPGQAVAKEERCYRLSELWPLLVKFLIPETAPRPRPGAPVSVMLLMDSERTYTARVQRVSPVVDPASAAIEVTAQLAGPDLRGLRPGMAVRVLWHPEAGKP